MRNKAVLPHGGFSRTLEIRGQIYCRIWEKVWEGGGGNSGYTRRNGRTLANDSICLFLGGVARASVFGDYASWRRLINRKQAAVSQVPAQSFAAVEIKRIVV